MSAYLNVAVREHESSTVLHIEGELDLGSSRELDEVINLAQRKRPPVLVVDLEKLRFIDMAGLRVLIAARERADQEGQQLVLVNLRAPVRRIVNLARMGEWLPELG